jgi:hypothetical protein
MNAGRAQCNRGLGEIRHIEDSYNPPIVEHQTLHEHLRDVIEVH